MKRIIITTLLITASIVLSAQSELLPKGLTVEQYSDEFLDSLDVKKDLKINDYSMFGISYGANLSKVMWNPAQKQESILIHVLRI